MLSSNQQGKKELKKDHSTAQPKSTIHPPWNSSTRAPLRKKSEKQELGSIEGLKKLTRTTSRPAFSPALSTSNSFSRLNEFDSRNTSITFASTKNQFSTFNTQLKQKLTLISKPVSTPSIRRTVINQSPSQNDLFVMFERILASNNPTDKELKSSTKKLRQLVTLHGLPQVFFFSDKFISYPFIYKDPWIGPKI